MTAPLVDQAARERARTDVGTSLLVEASAGTGKTKTLVDRIVCLVLDEGEPLSTVAALTFTEKAAGEMKARLRTRLDEEARSSSDADRRERALRARRDLDGAEVTTIHSFCARLLRERPVEAGVDPDFVVPEEGVARELFEEVFAGWVDEEARSGGVVTDALRRGLSPNALHDLARTIYEERSLVSAGTIPNDPLPYVRLELAGLADAGDRAVEEFPPDLRTDAKALLLRSAVEEVRGLLPLDLDALAAARLETKIDFRVGKRGVYAGRLKELADAFRDGWKELPERLASLADERLLARVAASVRDGLLPRLESRMRERGLLDFDDLLLAARDLLRNSRAAREHFQARFPHLVVDEFQDTDPVQAEIVLRISCQDGVQDVERWDGLVPAPSALFLVGDPKQSIYRFRRADVEIYRQVADRLPPSDRLSLVTNFRSSPRLLDFANGLFESVFESAPGAPWDVAHAPFAPDPAKLSRPDDGKVLFLAAPGVPDLHDGGEGERPAPESEGDDDGLDAEVKLQEARAVANLLLSRFSGSGFRGTAVLLGSNDAIDLYQEVFRDAGIPAVLEGGVSFYRREETAAVVAALRAIDDPADSISTVAALKSFLFGLTDVELLDASEARTRYDDPSAAPASGPVAEALGALAALRARRHARPFAETLLDLLSSRSALAAVENGAVVNPLQAAANLDRLLVLARALDGEGLPFRDAVARLALRLEEKVSEPRAFEEDEDAVRLMTLHKAKGLEFDTVVVASLGFRDRERTAGRRALVHTGPGRPLALSASMQGRKVRTPGFRSIVQLDDARELAEEKRQLYVALTRAKRTLVLSWFRRRRRLKSGEVSDTIGKSLLAPIAFAETLPPRLAPLVEVVLPDVSAPPSPERPAAPPFAVDLVAEIAAAEARLARARATASRPLRRSGEKEALGKPFLPGSGEAGSAEDLPSLERQDEVHGPAVRLGTAVHEAMELLLDPSRTPPASADEAVAASTVPLDPTAHAEAVRLVERLLALPVVARARASRRRFVELPILFRDDALDGAPLVEGKVDLLFEEVDGWVVVDWKTDRLATPAVRAEREALYAPQLASYARALVALLGPGTRVKETLLAFARG
ncbi:MAG: UvrD-helicase domain-containing protein [Thermoanaerobaculia bacterium]